MGTELRDTTPKMSKGVAMMLKSVLGIEPEVLFAHFSDTIQMMKDFCAHFDRRMVEVAKQTSELSDRIAALEKALEKHAIISSPEVSGDQLKELSHANGYDATTSQPDNADAGRSDQVA